MKDGIVASDIPRRQRLWVPPRSPWPPHATGRWTGALYALLRVHSAKERHQSPTHARAMVHKSSADVHDSCTRDAQSSPGTDVVTERAAHRPDDMASAPVTFLPPLLRRSRPIDVDWSHHVRARRVRRAIQRCTPAAADEVCRSTCEASRPG